MFDLKVSDLPELERLAKSGYGWIARDWNEQVYAYTAKPFKNTTTWVGGAKCEKIIGLGINSQIGVRWSDPEPLNIAAAIAQIKAQKIDGDSNEKCPICEYKISGCQCRYGGSAHPDRNDKRRVVFDHLHLLSLTQLQHVISLEKYWQISYSDADLNAILKRLIANSQCEGGENE